MIILNYINPCSSKFNSWKEFNCLTRPYQFLTIIIIGILSILALRTSILPLFRLLVGRLKVFTTLKNPNNVKQIKEKASSILQKNSWNELAPDCLMLILQMTNEPTNLSLVANAWNTQIKKEFYWKSILQKVMGEREENVVKEFGRQTKRETSNLTAQEKMKCLTQQLWEDARGIDSAQQYIKTNHLTIGSLFSLAHYHRVRELIQIEEERNLVIMAKEINEIRNIIENPENYNKTPSEKSKIIKTWLVEQKKNGNKIYNEGTDSIYLAELQLTILSREMIDILQELKCKGLCLRQNNIQHLPKEISKLRLLNTLDLSNNQIQKIPKEIEGLNHLKVLQLNNNRLQELPEEIGNLKVLKELFLENNQLTQIPTNLKKLNLEKLDISSNPIKNLSKEIVHLKSLQALSIDNCNLKEFPEEIGTLTNLIYLSADKNRWTAIPSVLNKLQNLKHLSLKGHHLKTFPEVIFDLKNLKNLHLDDNPIASLPGKIGDLKKLQELSLSHNLLDHIPLEIKHLTDLYFLNLSHNQLQVLPKEIAMLSKLEYLLISHNQLIDFPRECANFTKLYALDLSYNQLTHISGRFPSHLSNLNLCGNPEVNGIFGKFFRYTNLNDTI